MLHIFLGLLKIIGIVLAVIIGLVLLIVFVVLFTAMRYEIKASAEGDVKSIDANVKFSWLFHLISGFVSYKEQNIDWQVKIAWKKLNVPENEEKKKEASINKTEPAKIEVKEETTIQELAEPIVENVSEMKTETNEAPSKKSKKSKKKKEPIGEKIRCSIQKISDKIKEIKAMKDKIVSFINAEEHKKAFQKFLKEIVRLLKKLKPKKLKANVEVGFEDPYTTGSILAYASMLYPFYGDNISIRPNFEEVVMKGDLYIKGHLRISYFANMGIRLILNRNIRLTIKDIMKLIAKK